MQYLKRFDKVIEMMKEEGMDQFLLSDPMAIYYLTGNWVNPLERFYLLLIDQKGAHRFLLNNLFCIENKTPAEEIWFSDTDDPVSLLADCLEKDAVIGVDKNWPARFFLPLLQKCPNNRYIDGSHIVDTVRMVKDPQEQLLMKIASQINDRAIEQMIDFVKENPKATEKEMAEKLGNVYQAEGAEGFSFDPIFAIGANAADPHHEPDDTVLKPGDCLLIDIGCVKDRYCSDMTRTVYYGEPSEKAKEIYEIVLEANLRGIEAAKPGAKFCDVDLAARNYIEEKGYGKYFTHRTGHSIGLTDHEYGDVSSTNTEILKPGMIISVEPGIYLPGQTGVRIEDLILITETGNEVLNHVSKDLKIL